MKWRNQLLALLCLAAFAGLGMLYFRLWVIQKPFAVILFIGEGLTPDRVALTRLYTGGADGRLTIEQLPHAALLVNASENFAVPDQAAAATAIASGVRTNNQSLGVGREGNRAANLMEIARSRGRATGLITDARITSPTTAAFYAHSADPADRESFASELAKGDKIDIVMGGGADGFLPVEKGGARKDGHDLLLELRGNGVEVLRTRGDLEAVPAWRRPRVFGAFAAGDLAFDDQAEERRDQPSLGDMVRRAVELLEYNRSGYLLVVDSGLMRIGAQTNRAERTLSATAAFDRAVGVARRYAGPKSTMVICGDVGIGGLALSGFPFRKDSGVALTGLNASGQPWLTWASGPNGAAIYGAGQLRNKQDAGPSPSNENGPNEQVEPAAFNSKAAFNTAGDVSAFGSGPGTNRLSGTGEATTIFGLIRDQL